MDFSFPTLLSLLLLVVTLLAYGGSHAESVTPPQQQQLDLSRALVEFKVKVMGIFDITGWFRNVQGSMVDSGRAGDPDLDITVSVESVDTRHYIRDRFLIGPAFFDADRFPTIRFSQVRLLNENNIRKTMTGKLTLRGITQPVVFELTPSQRAFKADRQRSGDYVARTTIRRSDFGLGGFWASVSNDVEIMVYVSTSDI